MALLLDTRDVDPGARRDAVHDAYAQAGVPRQVDLTSQEAVDSTRIEGWVFGSTKLFSTTSPGIRFTRDSPSGRLDPKIVLCIQHRGTGRSTKNGRQQVLMPGELLMVNPTARSEFLVSGATVAMEVPFDEIGVTVEIALKASTHLPASPLFSLVSQHLLALHAVADLVSTGATASDVGASTANLVRALIVSAALDDRSAQSAIPNGLTSRIVAYVRRHLTETDLTPVTIARAHNISVRYLYRLCDAAGVKLVEWIIEERLDGARKDLTTPGQAYTGIALISRRWGFKDPSHFSTRFRNAYGISPRDLQRRTRDRLGDQITSQP
jgi:AraC-like DNA-binding protein